MGERVATTTTTATTIFFCFVDLSWFFIMGLFAWFLKSHRRGSVAASNKESASTHKKALPKRCRFFLEKIARLCHSINNR
jgi:hypothetical protein